MAKLEYIREVRMSENSILFILKVLQSFRLSKIKLDFYEIGNRKMATFPKVNLSKGDFIWITNMRDEDLENTIKYQNTSKTNTVVLQFDDPRSIIAKFEIDNLYEDVEESILIL